MEKHCTIQQRVFVIEQYFKNNILKILFHIALILRHPLYTRMIKVWVYIVENNLQLLLFFQLQTNTEKKIPKKRKNRHIEKFYLTR